LTTFGLTVIFDLTVAIEVGLLLAVLLFMRRMTDISNVEVITRELKDREEKPGDLNTIVGRTIPEGVEVYEINGPFFFGAASKFKESMRIVENPPKIRILRMRNVPVIDATGLNMLRELVSDSSRKGTKIILSGIHPQPLSTMNQYGIVEEIGIENIFDNIDDALERAHTML
ncbi:MAG: STAS domain-containing protein, partial [Chlorobium sp.]|nr:STAS domain-containing protein [Chlorobium sp.]